MNEIKKCAICGTTAEKKIITTVHGIPMCSKHKAQFYRHGKIIDKTPITTQDKNQIILFDDHAEIIIRNKTNAKEYRAIIDLDDVARVSKYKWRYEFQGPIKHGYVVTGNSKNGKTYLHRLIINYSGELQVDHINRNTLDNRKNNLRIVQQIINAQNVTTERNNIEVRNDKFRVNIVRFKRRFLFGLYDTVTEAEKILNEFLMWISENQETMTENYYDNKNFKNQKTINLRMYKTIEDMIEDRPDIQSLLINKERKTA